MVHRWSRLLALLAALGLVATGCGAEREGPPAEYTLVVGDSFPTSHPFSRDGARFFVDRASELSGGRLQFEYYPSENLGAAQDFVTLADAGVIDVAMISPGYVSTQLPLSGVADLPGMSTDPCRAALALEPLLAEGGVLSRADFAPDGLRPLVVGVVTGYEVMTGGGRVVTDPADVVGLTLRSSGGTIDRTVQDLGAAPVAMPVTELYEAISRGTVDGTVLGPLSALPYRLDEAATNSTLGAQLGSFTITYSIAQRVWEQLPPDLRGVMDQAGRDTTRHLLLGGGGLRRAGPAAAARGRPRVPPADAGRDPTLGRGRRSRPRAVGRRHGADGAAGSCRARRPARLAAGRVGDRAVRGFDTGLRRVEDGLAGVAALALLALAGLVVLGVVLRYVLGQPIVLVVRLHHRLPADAIFFLALPWTVRDRSPRADRHRLPRDAARARAGVTLVGARARRAVRRRARPGAGSR